MQGLTLVADDLRTGGMTASPSCSSSPLMPQSSTHAALGLSCVDLNLRATLSSVPSSLAASARFHPSPSMVGTFSPTSAEIVVPSAAYDVTAVEECDYHDAAVVSLPLNGSTEKGRPPSSGRVVLKYSPTAASVAASSSRLAGGCSISLSGLSIKRKSSAAQAVSYSSTTNNATPNTLAAAANGMPISPGVGGLHTENNCLSDYSQQQHLPPQLPFAQAGGARHITTPTTKASPFYFVPPTDDPFGLELVGGSMSSIHTPQRERAQQTNTIGLNTSSSSCNNSSGCGKGVLATSTRGGLGGSGRMGFSDPTVGFARSAGTVPYASLPQVFGSKLHVGDESGACTGGMFPPFCGSRSNHEKDDGMFQHMGDGSTMTTFEGIGSVADFNQAMGPRTSVTFAERFQGALSDAHETERRLSQQTAQASQRQR